MSESQKEERAHGWREEFWEIIKVLLISLAIVLPVRYFIAQPFIVRGASMEPNFENREYLIIDELSYYFRIPQRSEVVVFRYPHDTHQFFIKRIIGLPSERIEIKNGRIKIFNISYPNGFLLTESYLEEHIRTYPDTNIVLNETSFFVLGDNRDFSSDSRIWGPLERQFLVGRTFFRVFPISRFGVL